MDLVVLRDSQTGLWQWSAFGRRLAWGRVKRNVVDGIRRQMHAQVKKGFSPPRPWPSLKGGEEVRVTVPDQLFADLVNQK